MSNITTWALHYLAYNVGHVGRSVRGEGGGFDKGLHCGHVLFRGVVHVSQGNQDLYKIRVRRGEGK